MAHATFCTSASERNVSLFPVFLFSFQFDSLSCQNMFLPFSFLLCFSSFSFLSNLFPSQSLRFSPLTPHPPPPTHPPPPAIPLPTHTQPVAGFSVTKTVLMSNPLHRERERQTERQRETETERERQRQTNRQTNRQTETETDTERQRRKQRQR